MIKVDVLVNSRGWTKYIKNPNNYLNNKLKRAEKKIGIFKKHKLQFTLLLSDCNEIKKLNKKFRNKNKITDILSFPFYEKKILFKLIKKEKNVIYLGDIIINLKEIIKQSKKQDFSLTFNKLWIHGLTHLLGYRHKSNQDFSLMHKLENKIIKSIQ
jgi:probable rRNA maturation factor